MSTGSNNCGKVPSVYNIPYKSKEKAELVITEFNKNYPDHVYCVVEVQLPVN